MSQIWSLHHHMNAGIVIASRVVSEPVVLLVLEVSIKSFDLK